MRCLALSKIFVLRLARSASAEGTSSKRCNLAFWLSAGRGQKGELSIRLLLT